MRLLIWGTSETARKLTGAKCVREGDITGYISSRPRDKTFQNKDLYSPDKLVAIEYDVILVAVMSQAVNEIYRTIQELNLPLDKICFMRLPTVTAPGVSEEKNKELVRKILNEEGLCWAGRYLGDGVADFICSDLEVYQALNTRESFQYIELNKYFIYHDKYADAGALGQYFFQDLWAAKWINCNNPVQHFDIGSRIDGFIAHLLAFRDNITLIDIREQPGEIPGVNFIQADATNLDTLDDNSIESLSALCSLEHFGLGRYGDPIDPEACFKAFRAIQRKMRPGGYVYISVPVGMEHLEFNAHRIFYAKTVVESFDEMQLIEYSATDGKTIDLNIPLNIYDRYDQYDSAVHGAGITGLFCFKKPDNTSGY